MGKRVKEFEVSAIWNNMSYKFYLNRLINMSVSMFDWSNLPDSVDARFIETRLFMNGAVVFFKDADLQLDGDKESDGNILCLDMLPHGAFDIYGYPTLREGYSPFNNYRILLKPDNSVVCYNNYLKEPSYMGCVYYAKRLWFLDRIIDVNANAQKTPVLLQGDEKSRLTLLNLYKEFDGNSPVIHGNKNLDLKGFTVLKTDAPYVGDKLTELKTLIWNDAMTYLGISNTSYQKKERLISDEVIRSMGGTIASRYSRLNARREAVERINKMFGTNIEVNFRDDIQTLDYDGGEVVSSSLGTESKEKEGGSSE